MRMESNMEMLRTSITASCLYLYCNLQQLFLNNNSKSQKRWKYDVKTKENNWVFNLIGILSGQFAFSFKILRHERTISTSFFCSYIHVYRLITCFYGWKRGIHGNLIHESLYSNRRVVERVHEWKNIHILICRTCHTVLIYILDMS